MTLQEERAWKRKNWKFGKEEVRYKEWESVKERMRMKETMWKWEWKKKKVWKKERIGHTYSWSLSESEKGLKYWRWYIGNEDKQLCELMRMFTITPIRHSLKCGTAALGAIILDPHYNKAFSFNLPLSLTIFRISCQRNITSGHGSSSVDECVVTWHQFLIFFKIFILGSDLGREISSSLCVFSKSNTRSL